MNPSHRILTVEDDAQMSVMLTFCLQREGYRVIETFDGESGLAAALRERPDLIVLDLDLPKIGGLEVCSELRRLHFQAPILMLTGRAKIEDKVTGLDSGADDYLAKPFVPREFVARVRALLRRKTRTEASHPILTFGDVQVDLRTRTAKRGGEPLELTRTEYALLEVLAQKPGQPVSRETMLDVVWGYTRFPSTRTIDTHIWRLRKKIGDTQKESPWIKGSVGKGYCLAAECVNDASRAT